MFGGWLFGEGLFGDGDPQSSSVISSGWECDGASDVNLQVQEIDLVENTGGFWQWLSFQVAARRAQQGNEQKSFVGVVGSSALTMEGDCQVCSEAFAEFHSREATTEQGKVTVRGESVVQTLTPDAMMLSGQVKAVGIRNASHEEMALMIDEMLS